MFQWNEWSQDARKTMLGAIQPSREPNIAMKDKETIEIVKKYRILRAKETSTVTL